jgi:hypothetical protein
MMPYSKEDDTHPIPRTPAQPPKPPKPRPGGPGQHTTMTDADYERAVQVVGTRVAEAQWDENTGSPGDRAAAIAVRAKLAVRPAPAAA